MQLPGGAALLCANDPTLRAVVRRTAGLLSECLSQPDSAAADSFQRNVAAAIAPFNVAGLCDPGVRNMYRYTAVTARTPTATTF